MGKQSDETITDCTPSSLNKISLTTVRRKGFTSRHILQQVSVKLISVHALANAFEGRSSELRENDVIKGLASKYKVSPVQIILAWGNARGISLCTQSSDEERRKDALNVRLLQFTADLELR